MKIYLIKRDDYYLDEYISCVIVANNKKEVLLLAKELESMEIHKLNWDKAKITLISNYTGKRKLSFIIQSSFNGA